MNIFCVHATVVRTEGDRGPGVCARCGTAVDDGVLTPGKIVAACEAIRRQPHLMGCVQVGDEWVCASDCPVRFRR